MADQGNITTPNAANLNTAARRYAASQGWAMPDGAYPIRPVNLHGADDLSSAVRAVGRGGAAASTIRKHIMTRAKAIGLSKSIPDTWQSDGSLSQRAADEGQVFYRSFEPDLEIKKDGTGRTLVGYAVPFNQIQQIDQHLREAFDMHAFDHQLRAIHRVPYYRGHKRQGGVHVGHVALARPEPAGLYTEAKIAATPAGDETIELHRNGSLPDQSVGFVVARGGTQLREGVEWRVRAHLTEVAAVPVGAYGEGASISGIRAMDVGLGDASPGAAGASLSATGDGDFTVHGDSDDDLRPCPNCGYVATTDQARSKLEEARRLGLSLPRFLPL
jgi:Escherichia/Staphylococcus phage prohead protease